MEFIEDLEDTENSDSKQKKYMRDYKKKKYNENPIDIKNKNKAYYYKYKHNMTTEDMHKYNVYLPLIAKIRKNLDELKNVKPEFVKELLEPYLL